MVPVYDPYRGIFVNGLPVIGFDGVRQRRGDNWFPMWSYDGHSLGSVNDGCYLIECAAAHLLVSGRLAPQWERVLSGMRLIHPRYTLAVTQTPQGWRPTISDELTKKSHALRLRPACLEAMNVLDALLQRRVGRELPPFSLYKWFGDCVQYEDKWQFQLALEMAGRAIAKLIRYSSDDAIEWNGQSLECARKLATYFDRVCQARFDPAPRLATILATYIKLAVIGVYRGGRSIMATARGFPVIFNDGELRLFRERFRRTPITDNEYLAFAIEHFITPLDLHRRRQVRRWHGLQDFHPKKPSYLSGWTGRPGTRLLGVARAPMGGRHEIVRRKVA